MAVTDLLGCDDRALTQKVREGDSRAFDILFARHRDIIYSMLVKRTSSSTDVEDLMQEAFMKAFIHIDRYNPEHDFGAWICTIAKNTLVDFSRSRRAKALNSDNNLSLDGRASAAQALSPTPEESIINAQLGLRIERSIARLPEAYRRMFTMRFLEEYSYEEIAEALGMKLGTVKTQIFRARNMMCKLITEGEGL